MQDLEVAYFHAFIDGVDFVFIECPMFRHMGHNIYGGKREVRDVCCQFSFNWFSRGINNVFLIDDLFLSRFMLDCFCNGSVADLSLETTAEEPLPHKRMTVTYGTPFS